MLMNGFNVVWIPNQEYIHLQFFPRPKRSSNDFSGGMIPPIASTAIRARVDPMSFVNVVKLRINIVNNYTK